MNYYAAAVWKYFENGFKFYVDEVEKHIVISPTVTTLNIKDDVYEALKEWSRLYNNLRYTFPMRSIGGDPTIAGEKAGDIYFMINGYRIVYNPSNVQVSGVLFSDDYDTAWLDSDTLIPVYPARVSSLVNTVEPSLAGLNFPTSIENAQAVWDEILSLHAILGSAGKQLSDIDTTPTPTVSEIVDAVWTEDLTTYITAGTAGKRLDETGHISKTIFIDTENPINGDGTAGTPFNNINDVKDHAEAEGIREIVTYSELILNTNFKNYIIRGLAAPIVDTNGQDISGSEFFHCTMKGTYTGAKPIVCQESVLDDGFQLTGFFENCIITGTVNIVGSALVKHCASGIPGVSTPIFNMNAGIATSLSIRDWSGGLLVQNCDHVDDICTVEISQGRLFLDNTNTTGLISIRGLAFFDDTSAGTTVETSGLLDPSKSQLTDDEQTQLFDALTKKQFIGLK